MSAIIDEVGLLIKEGRLGAPVLGAWIYGSRAITPERSESDIDLLVVFRHYGAPRRISLRLSDGSQLSANVIGPNSVSGHSVGSNGGFYFTGKLLGPRYLLAGDPEECRGLLAHAVANLIYPWVTCLLPDSAAGCPLSVGQLLSLQYLLLIRINYCYLRHFAGWLCSSKFHDVWSGATELVRDALVPLAAVTDLKISPNHTVAFLMRERCISEAQRRVLSQYLCSSFWQFNFQLREHSQEFLDTYFTRQLDVVSKLSNSHMADAWRFLRDNAGVDLLL